MRPIAQRYLDDAAETARLLLLDRERDKVRDRDRERDREKDREGETERERDIERVCVSGFRGVTFHRYP